MEREIIKILEAIEHEIRAMNSGLEAMGEFCDKLEKESAIQQMQILQIQNDIREMKHLNLPKFN